MVQEMVQWLQHPQPGQTIRERERGGGGGGVGDRSKMRGGKGVGERRVDFSLDLFKHSLSVVHQLPETSSHHLCQALVHQTRQKKSTYVHKTRFNVLTYSYTRLFRVNFVLEEKLKL